MRTELCQPAFLLKHETFAMGKVQFAPDSASETSRIVLGVPHLGTDSLQSKWNSEGHGPARGLDRGSKGERVPCSKRDPEFPQISK